MEPPQKIVSLISSATEILFAIGVGERVVAVSHECDYPAEANGRPRVTRSIVDSSQSSGVIDAQVRQLSASGAALYALDADFISKLCPDLIITQAQCDVCAVRYQDVLELVATDPCLRDASVLALNPRSLDDVFADILRIGRAAGVERDSERFAESLRMRVARIVSRTSSIDVASRPRTICIEWIEPLMIAANWTPELVEMAGGAYGLSRGGHSTYSSWTDVIQYDPEVIVIAPCGFDLARSIPEARVLTSIDGWHRLSAVKSNRVHVIDGSAYLNRSGPRLVDSLEILAWLLQPQLSAVNGVPEFGCSVAAFARGI